MDIAYKFNLNDFNSFVPPTPSGPDFESTLHYISAGVFFVALAILVLKHFIKSEKNGDNSRKRILQYKFYGVGMLLLVLSIIIISMFFENEEYWSFPATFTLESLALALFGIAWLIRGKVEELNIIRRDKKSNV